MTYPDYPNNRLIVQGVDLTKKFKMVLGDGYTLSPPEPKTYIVDIPGGNGSLDLTEYLIGDVAYNNRKMEFTMCVIDTPNFEKVKTQVSNFLHGKSFDFQLSMDPGYTYHGRFTIGQYSHSVYSNAGRVGAFKITVDAEPYKYREAKSLEINPIGGDVIKLESGRKSVRPTFEVKGTLKVIYNNTLYRLPEGSWTINDLIFKEGVNEVYVSNYDIRTLTWGNLVDDEITWKNFKMKPLYEWYKSKGEGLYVPYTWDELDGQTWNSFMSGKRWKQLIHLKDVGEGDAEPVNITYEWGDL